MIRAFKSFRINNNLLTNIIFLSQRARVMLINFHRKIQNKSTQAFIKVWEMTKVSFRINWISFLIYMYMH